MVTFAVSFTELPRDSSGFSGEHSSPASSPSAESDPGLGARWADCEVEDEQPLPCLLGQRRHRTEPVMKGERKQPLPSPLYRRAFTAPAFKVKNTFIEGLADEEEEDDLLVMGRRRSCPYKFSHDDGVLSEPGEGHNEAAASAAAPVEIAPLEVRQPEWSMGSAIHGSGSCRPCAWFWRPQGCTNGAECLHCHQCLAGEVKARRKAKRKSTAFSQECEGAMREREDATSGRKLVLLVSELV